MHASMAAPDPYEEFLARLRDPDVGRVGAREMLREVLLRLPGAWDPRVLEAARELTRRFPPLAAEFPVIEQWARIPVNVVMTKSLGAEEKILATVAAAGRPEAERLLREVRAERGREKAGRARILFALGKRMLDFGDRKNARSALREAAQSAPLRREIDAILDDLPGAKGRDWRSANGTVVISGNPSEPAALRVSGRDAPPRAFVEERLLGAPLLSPAGDPNDPIKIDVTLEHDTERVRTGSVRSREVPTAPMIGLVVRERGKPIAVVCGPFVSPIERFANAAIEDATHVSIRAGASFQETRLEAVRPPNEGDGWLVIRAGRPFVRTRGGCWLRTHEKSDLAGDTRVRFRVTRAGLVYVARDVTPVL